MEKLTERRHRQRGGVGREEKLTEKLTERRHWQIGNIGRDERSGGRSCMQRGDVGREEM